MTLVCKQDESFKKYTISPRKHDVDPLIATHILPEALVAQWIRPQTLSREVPGSNLLAAAVEPLGKALYPHCLVLRKGLKAVGLLVACL